MSVAPGRPKQLTAPRGEASVASFAGIHRSRQRGWLGLVGLLIALAIVALLAMSALRQYGLTGGASHPGTAPKATDTTTLPATPPGNAAEIRRTLGRAREASDLVEKGAAERARAVEEGAR